MRRAKLRDGYIVCPKCGKIILQVLSGGFGYGLVVKCHRCHELSVIEVDRR